eukprot:1156510-Pelagomonas_calceolata.AAC.3
MVKIVKWCRPVEAVQGSVYHPEEYSPGFAPSDTYDVPRAHACPTPAQKLQGKSIDPSRLPPALKCTPDCHRTFVGLCPSFNCSLGHFIHIVPATLPNVPTSTVHVLGSHTLESATLNTHTNCTHVELTHVGLYHTSTYTRVNCVHAGLYRSKL